MASGGVIPYTWSAPGLPDGLSITTVSNSGVISGIPTSAKVYSFNVTVMDSSGATATRSFQVRINSK